MNGNHVIIFDNYKFFGLADTHHNGLEGITGVGREGKPRALSSLPHMGLLSVVSV
jgi:hypothetical protein